MSWLTRFGSGRPRRPQLGRRLVPSDEVARLLARSVQSSQTGSRFGARLGHVHRYRLARRWGVYLHPCAVVGDVSFPHPTSIVIGAGVRVEDGVIIYQQVTLGASDVGGAGYPTVRRHARIYAGAAVIGEVEVGEGAVVGANSVVLDDVAPWTTVAGSPARVVGHRSPPSGTDPR